MFWISYQHVYQLISSYNKLLCRKDNGPFKRPIKNRLKSSMEDNRLSSLLILLCECDNLAQVQNQEINNKPFPL